MLNKYELESVDRLYEYAVSEEADKEGGLDVNDDIKEDEEDEEEEKEDENDDNEEDEEDSSDKNN